MPKRRTPSVAKKQTKKITYVTLMADESLNPKFDEALKKFESKLGRTYPMYIG